MIPEKFIACNEKKLADECYNAFLFLIFDTGDFSQCRTRFRHADDEKQTDHNAYSQGSCDKNTSKRYKGLKFGGVVPWVIWKKFFKGATRYHHFTDDVSTFSAKIILDRNIGILYTVGKEIQFWTTFLLTTFSENEAKRSYDSLKTEICEL